MSDIPMPPRMAGGAVPGVPPRATPATTSAVPMAPAPLAVAEPPAPAVSDLPPAPSMALGGPADAPMAAAFSAAPAPDTGHEGAGTFASSVMGGAHPTPFSIAFSGTTSHQSVRRASIVHGVAVADDDDDEDDASDDDTAAATAGVGALGVGDGAGGAGPYPLAGSFMNVPPPTNEANDGLSLDVTSLDFWEANKPVMQGWVTKQGGSHKSWKQRYLVGDKDGLKYYASFKEGKGFKNYKGEIRAGMIRSVKWDQSATGEDVLTLHITTPGRVYLVKTEDVNSRDMWMRVIEEMAERCLRLEKAIATHAPVTTLQQIVMRGVCGDMTAEGVSLLHFAMLRANENAAMFVLDQHVDPNVTNAQGESPLHVACKTGMKNVVERLLSLNVPLTTKALPYQALHLACGYEIGVMGEQTAEVAEVKQYIACLLLEKGAPYKDKIEWSKVPSDVACNGLTPLLLALRSGQNQTVANLLGKGVKLNDQDSHGNDPMSYAVSTPACLHTVLQAGGKLKRIDMKKRWFQRVAANKNGDYVSAKRRDLLHMCCMFGCAAVCKELVTKHAFSPSNQCSHKAGFPDVGVVKFTQPIHLACTFGNWSVLRFLLESGVDPNAPSEVTVSYLTPLFLCARGTCGAIEQAIRSKTHNLAKCAILLLQAGVKPDKAPGSASSKWGNGTIVPLDVALAYGNLEVAAVLILAGSSVVKCAPTFSTHLRGLHDELRRATGMETLMADLPAGDVDRVVGALVAHVGRIFAPLQAELSQLSVLGSK